MQPSCKHSLTHSYLHYLTSSKPWYNNNNEILIKREPLVLIILELGSLYKERKREREKKKREREKKRRKKKKKKARTVQQQ